MISMDDPRWEGLEGGYRVPYDPRPALRALDGRSDISATWAELWNELHHQRDVGLASYAAVPHIAGIYIRAGRPDWNAYALVGCIELARTERNPPLPDWLEGSYIGSLGELAKQGTKEIWASEDRTLVQSALAVIALARGLRIQANLLLSYTEDELEEMVPG